MTTTKASSVESGVQDGLPGLESDPSEAGEVSTERVGLYDRMRTLRDTYDFIPTSRGETNEAFGLLHDLGTPNSTVGHLTEILNFHLRKTDERIKDARAATQRGGEPEIDAGAWRGKARKTGQAAVHSVTREYAGYAGKARADMTALVALKEELADLGAYEGSTRLSELSLQNGTAQLVRYHDLWRLLAIGECDINPFLTRRDRRRSALDPYTLPTPSREMVDHMAGVLGGLRLDRSHAWVDCAIEDQGKRFKFWVARLQEAQINLVAAPVARAALEKMGIILHA